MLYAPPSRNIDDEVTVEAISADAKCDLRWMSPFGR
jgi:hypothetical protein